MEGKRKKHKAKKVEIKKKKKKKNISEYYKYIYIVEIFMELRKLYSRVGIHKLMEFLFSTFIIYFNLKLQIDNPLIGSALTP
jgi:hypothetical protein